MRVGVVFMHFQRRLCVAHRTTAEEENEEWRVNSILHKGNVI